MCLGTIRYGHSYVVLNIVHKVVTHMLHNTQRNTTLCTRAIPLSTSVAAHTLHLLSLNDWVVNKQTNLWLQSVQTLQL